MRLVNNAPIINQPTVFTKHYKIIWNLDIPIVVHTETMKYHTQLRGMDKA